MCSSKIPPDGEYGFSVLVTGRALTEYQHPKEERRVIVEICEMLLLVLFSFCKLLWPCHPLTRGQLYHVQHCMIAVGVLRFQVL